MEAIIIDNNGHINDFSSSAERLLEDYISSIQIAPKGFVTDIYPSQGNEAGKIDLFDNPTRGPIVQYSLDNDLITMQGPFTLKQGGQGIAIRNPIFLTDQKGNKEFWGFTIVIIKSPTIYEETLAALKTFGYNYSLDVKESPLSTKTARIVSSFAENSPHFDSNSKSFRIDECDWTLTVSSISTESLTNVRNMVIINILSILAITFMSYLLLGLYEQKKQLHRLANRDELTGLLSRRGFMEKLDKVFTNNPKNVTIAFIDLDDFKAINDVHGHAVGDLALKNLARELQDIFPKDSVIGRTGGDEFCILINNHPIESVKETIKNAVSTKHFFEVEDNRYCFYTISVGYTNYHSQTTDRSHLLILADEALYAAKLDGKNNSKYYEPEMSDIKRTHLGFSIKSFTSGIPGGLLVYKAYGDEQILYANDYMIKLAGCNSFEDFLTFTKASFSNLIHPDDVERVEKSIWSQINKLKNANDEEKHLDDFVEYRIKTKTGESKEVLDFGRLVHDENYGEIFFVYIRDKESFEDMT